VSAPVVTIVRVDDDDVAIVSAPLARGGPLPRIVRFLETHDGGPGGATCPHCGATGRYVHTFEVEGGRRLGAMSGCVKLFPVAPVAREEARLRKKGEDYRKRGWDLNRDDQAALDAVEAYYAGTVSEAHALSACARAKAAARDRFMRRGQR
jgi:hypothetical protein